MKWENIIKKGKRTDEYGRQGRDRRRPVGTPFNPFGFKGKEKKTDEFNIKDLHFQEIVAAGMHRADYKVNDEYALSIIGGAYYNSTPQRMLGDGDEYTEWEVGVLKNGKFVEELAFLTESDIRKLIERLRKK